MTETSTQVHASKIINSILEGLMKQLPVQLQEFSKPQAEALLQDLVLNKLIQADFQDYTTTDSSNNLN